ncbi:MAG: hypothetical protein S4CHLAM20_11080 [Chlamydiia bacterium]|nr:hypothetical protein [Chlamydiia bacterium]
MMYGISELRQVYNQWVDDKDKEERFAISFFSPNCKTPFIFSGLDSILEYLNKQIFSDQEIAYLHSLQKESGKLLFSDQFIKFISQLRFEFKMESILVGSVFFSSQPIIKVSGKLVVLSFLKKVLSYYLPRQIQIATEIEKIVSFAAPCPIIAQNSFRSFESKGELDVRSAFLGGASATEDLFAASKYTIPICFYEDSSLKFLDIAHKNFFCEVSNLKPTDSLILKGVNSLEKLEEIPFERDQLKGICIDLSTMEDRNIEIKYHYYRNQEILDPDFMIYRFSHKGLYIGDLITKDLKKDLRKTLFGKYISTLKKRNILYDIEGMQEDTLFDQKRRVLKNMRLLPCKFRLRDSEHVYPVRFLKKSFSQENSVSLSNTRLA